MGGMYLPTSRVVGGTVYRRAPYFRTKKVGLLGRTENVRDAPWADPSWTFASHTSARAFCKREPDWYFDLHRAECYTTENKPWNPRYHSWLKALQVPIFMQQNLPDVPMSVRYPIETVLQEYRAYFTNHCAYMIALAMMEGVTHIGLWGCQYGADGEYSMQRGSLEYWLGRFEQAGGHVILPVRANTLLSYPAELYGYESHDAQGKLTGGYKDALKYARGRIEQDGQVKLLEPIDPTEKRPALTPPPPGETIAWHRRDTLFTVPGPTVVQ